MAAGLVATADEWAWSSDRAHVCMAPTPSRLDSDGLHDYLLGRSVASQLDCARAAQKYAALVTDTDEGEASLWQTGLRQQVFLGDEDFVARMQALAPTEQRSAVDVPKRRSASRPARCRIA